MTGNDAVILFIKAPQRGIVKSRLGTSVGDDIALDLYKCFVDDTTRMLSETGHQFTPFFYPADSRDHIVSWLGPEMPVLPQRGADLGERMKNAFKAIFSRGSTRAVLIGSDMPDLPGTSIDEALMSLENHDAVIGPSYDGGYYLIGFSSDSFLPDVFDGIAWSTARVFQQTLAILHGSKYRVHTLQKRRDIDTFDDLKAFFYDNLSSSPGPLTTMKYILSHVAGITPDVRCEDKI